MARFFVSPEEMKSDFFVLTGENAQHAKVLRLKAGEEVLVCDGAGNECVCTVSDVSDGQISLVVQKQQASASEAAVRVSVYMAFPKGDKLEHVIQKATELGAYEIVAFPSSRCISRPDEKSLKKKLERWQKIAASAAEQSGRGRIPQVLTLPSYQAALERAAVCDKALLFYEFTESDMEKFFESAYIENGFECYLWDKRSDFSFSWGDYSCEPGKEMLVEKENKIHSIVLVGYMNENSIQNMTLTFLNSVIYMITAVLLIVLAGYLLILYIAYKPVFHLTTKLKHVEGEEFEAIGRTLDDRRAKIEEQEMLLMDLLLNNLLYKAPISRSKLIALGVKEPGNYYTVFLLNGYVLTDADAKKMIAETEAVLPVKMFVTDLVGEDKSVFTLFLEKEEGEDSQIVPRKMQWFWRMQEEIA